MGKKNVEPGRPQIAIWRVLVLCWISKATNYSHCNNGRTNAPQCYVIRTLTILYILVFLTTLSVAELYSVAEYE